MVAQPPERSTVASRLPAAHLSLGLIALAAVVISAADSIQQPAGKGGESFWTAARFVQIFGVAYLGFTAGTQLVQGWSPGFGLSKRAGWFLLSTHAIVLLCSGYALMRGPASRTLLVGLDSMLPALVVVSGLSWLLRLTSWRVSVADAGHTPLNLRRDAISVLLVGFVGVGTAAGLGYLESLPRPKLAPPSQSK